MAHIYVYSPAGAVRDRSAFRRGIKRLTALGHDVEIDPDALTRWQRFAGDDATRLAAIARAAASGADIALISRGGYGLTRILPQLPWPAIANAAKNGTRFVGFSDFTALQLGALANGKTITWAGPALCETFGAVQNNVEPAEKGDTHAALNAIDEITLDCFADMASGASEGVGWRLPKKDLDYLNERGLSNLNAHDATLWGGNLSLVASLLGTPWWPNVSNGVLFLEDVGTHPYRVERLLTQLLHAGVLDQQAAIVLGQFTAYRLVSHDHGYSLAKVIDWLRTQTRTPVLTGLPFGHTPRKVLLPVGASIELLVQNLEALMVWGEMD